MLVWGLGVEVLRLRRGMRRRGTDCSTSGWAGAKRVGVARLVPAWNWPGPDRIEVGWRFGCWEVTYLFKQ